MEEFQNWHPLDTRIKWWEYYYYFHVWYYWRRVQKLRSGGGVVRVVYERKLSKAMTTQNFLNWSWLFSKTKQKSPCQPPLFPNKTLLIVVCPQKGFGLVDFGVPQGLNMVPKIFAIGKKCGIVCVQCEGIIRHIFHRVTHNNSFLC